MPADDCERIKYVRQEHPTAGSRNQYGSGLGGCPGVRHSVNSFRAASGSVAPGFRFAAR